MEKRPDGGGFIVNSAQSILGLCRNGFTKPPAIGEARTYMSTVRLNWQAFGLTKINRKNIRYEIGFRGDGQVAAPKKQARKIESARELVEKHLKGNKFTQESIVMPADYVEKLLKVEPKHTNRPCWDTADFSGMIGVLGSWLALVTWYPDSSLGDLAPPGGIKLSPVTSLTDSAALASDSIFISQTVSSRPGSGAYWALVAAASTFGGTVATDRVIMGPDDKPRFLSRRGHHLWRDILDALAILAELYNRAGAGEIFAYSFFKGLHSICTVVGHSDEGGLTRDVLRECAFPQPYGGLPSTCAAHAGMPTISVGASYSSLVGLVDSLCLKSAAAVAHCTKLSPTKSGAYRPYLVMGTLTQEQINGVPPLAPGADPQAQAAHNLALQQLAEARSNHVSKMRSGLIEGYDYLSKRYLPALCKILGLTPNDSICSGARFWMVQAIESVLSESDNRHLIKDVCLVPFFWIEPTTILQSNAFGTDAERFGWASWGCGDEAPRHKWFSSVEECDNASARWRYYEVDFEGARKCLWLSCLEGHIEDGLAQIHFKRVDPEALALVGGPVNRIGPDAAFDARMSINNYLWVRGQNSFPHPCECLHTGDRVVIAVNYYDPDSDSWIATVPSHNEIKDATVNMAFSAPSGLDYRMPASENTRERAYRTRAMQLLDLISNNITLPEEHDRPEGGYQKVSVVFDRAASGALRRSLLGLPDDREMTDYNIDRGRAHTEATEVEVGGRGEVQRAARIEATLIGAPIPGPKPPQPGHTAVVLGGGGAAAAVQPAAAADGGGPPPPPPDGGGGDGRDGVAPAGGAIDGQGAAGVAPARK